MTNQQVEDFTKELSTLAQAGFDIASIFVPMGATWLIIGKAVSVAVPSLEKTVSRWIEGNPPSPEEIAEFKAQLSVLTDPNNP